MSSICSGTGSYNIFQCGLALDCVDGRKLNSAGKQLAIDFDPIQKSRSPSQVLRGEEPQDPDGAPAVEEMKEEPTDSYEVKNTNSLVDNEEESTEERILGSRRKLPPVQEDSSPRTLQHQQAEELRQDDGEMKGQMSRFLQFDDGRDDGRERNPSPRRERTSSASDPALNHNDSIFSTTSSVKFLMGQVEDIDLDFVEEYDHAFNEFLSRFPRFLMDNPDLVHHIRIIKLQKMLEEQERQEQQEEAELDDAIRTKANTESGWHDQLRDAARKKAARETHLQSYLGGVHYNTKCMEAQLTWHAICDVERRAKKEHALQQQLAKARQEPFDDVDLMMLLPDGPDFDNVRDAMLAPAGEGLSVEQEKDLRQFQIDNAILAGELATLKKTLAQQKATSRKNAWVDSVLQRMDEKSLQKLKNRFRKRCGVPL